MATQPSLTGVESTFTDDEIIVSKTDDKGRITYANRVFMRVAKYKEEELLGKPQSLVRHPEMPRCVFKYLWDTIQSGHEVFAYIVNRCKDGDHYWVLAHVTPSFDSAGRITGYHSNRRNPDRQALAKVQALYAELLAVERQYSNPEEQWQASMPVLQSKLEEMGMTYDEYVWSLAA